MKKTTLLAVLLFTLKSFSQDCNNYLYMTNNAQVQMKIYDAKGKEAATQNWTITNVRKDGDGYASTITNVMVDDKGKELGRGTGEYRCNGGVMRADMRMTMPQYEQLQGAKPTEAKMDAAYIEYPLNMSAGQTLKDAEVNLDMDMSTGMTSNVEFKQTNRKVQAKESITTPAGTWDAYKITYNSFMRIKVVGLFGVPMNMTVTEWFVPGIGPVKTETYNKNGKLMGSTVISSIKK
ncbi:MAG: hypothetical protein ICV81_14795 [Flavisolibacter sp.]|nr:hypothetical protein [Flavisolibacter sp.]MBD0284794.1 hypothetical protein [Flavisolibacter sp.]